MSELDATKEIPDSQAESDGDEVGPFKEEGPNEEEEPVEGSESEEEEELEEREEPEEEGQDTEDEDPDTRSDQASPSASPSSNSQGSSAEISSTGLPDIKFTKDNLSIAADEIRNRLPGGFDFQYKKPKSKGKVRSYACVGTRAGNFVMIYTSKKKSKKHNYLQLHNLHFQFNIPVFVVLEAIGTVHLTTTDRLTEKKSVSFNSKGATTAKDCIRIMSADHGVTELGKLWDRYGKTLRYIPTTLNGKTPVITFDDNTVTTTSMVSLAAPPSSSSPASPGLEIPWKMLSDTFGGSHGHYSNVETTKALASAWGCKPWYLRSPGSRTTTICGIILSDNTFVGTSFFNSKKDRPSGPAFTAEGVALVRHLKNFPYILFLLDHEAATLTTTGLSDVVEWNATIPKATSGLGRVQEFPGCSALIGSFQDVVEGCGKLDGRLQRGGEEVDGVVQVLSLSAVDDGLTKFELTEKQVEHVRQKNAAFFEKYPESKPGRLNKLCLHTGCANSCTLDTAVIRGHSNSQCYYVGEYCYYHSELMQKKWNKSKYAKNQAKLRAKQGCKANLACTEPPLGRMCRTHRKVVNATRLRNLKRKQNGDPTTPLRYLVRNRARLRRLLEKSSYVQEIKDDELFYVDVEGLTPQTLWQLAVVQGDRVLVDETFKPGDKAAMRRVCEMVAAAVGNDSVFSHQNHTENHILPKVFEYCGVEWNTTWQFRDSLDFYREVFGEVEGYHSNSLPWLALAMIPHDSELALMNHVAVMDCRINRHINLKIVNVVETGDVVEIPVQTLAEEDVAADELAEVCTYIDLQGDINAEELLPLDEEAIINSIDEELLAKIVGPDSDSDSSSTRPHLPSSSGTTNREDGNAPSHQQPPDFKRELDDAVNVDSDYQRSAKKLMTAWTRNDKKVSQTSIQKYFKKG